MGMLTGGCFCGQIRYEVTGTPFFETLCHCSICRRTTGSAIVGWFTVRRSGFRIVSEEPKVIRSSDCATRSFCTTCGTQVTFQFDQWPQVIDVTIGDPSLFFFFGFFFVATSEPPHYQLRTRPVSM
jgi:hypothetical protein